ncbi:FecR family protein [Oceanospirillum multiglobuliferum]|nr:FecR family protein [Oceanospirillum multiglobuliferum]
MISKIAIDARKIYQIPLLLIVFSGFAWAGEAGKILFVHGKVNIISASGESRLAERGASVFEGDKIVSEAASSMQLKMIDSGYLAIRPSSVIRLDEYRFEQKENDTAQASLLKGGIRSITGVIGKTKKESFKLRTPVATIGIRGTDLELYYLPQKSRAGSVNGAYLRINSGRGYIQTQAGVQFVSSNQVAFATNSQQLPTLINNPPKFFNDPNEDPLADTGGEGSISDEGEANPRQVPPEDVRSGNTTPDSTSLNAKPKAKERSEPSVVNYSLPPDMQESWRINDIEEPVEVSYHEPTFSVVDNTVKDIENKTPDTTNGQDPGVIDGEAPKDPIEVSKPKGRYNYSTKPSFSGQNLSDSSEAALAIDFDSGIVNYSLSLFFKPEAGRQVAKASSENGGEWSFKGTGNISDLNTSGLVLSGYYLDYTDQKKYSAGGVWKGMFTGDNAESFTGSLDLFTLDNSLSFSGTSTSTNRDQSTINFLSGFSENSNNIVGYIQSDKNSDVLSNYQLWQENGQLVALVHKANQGQLLADSAVEKGLLAGGATVTWGHWQTGWSTFDGQDLLPQATPLHYIYADNLSDSAVLKDRQGTYLFNNIDSSVSNSLSEISTLSGDLTVDFSTKEAHLEFVSKFSQSSWSAAGRGSIASLQLGEFSISGLRTSIQDSTTEAASGKVLGQFSGENLNSLWGHFSLTSPTDYLSGVYAFSNPKLIDYLADLTLAGSKLGYLLEGPSVSSLDDYDLWQSDNMLLGAVNRTSQEQKVTKVTTQKIVPSGESRVVWGSWLQGWNRINDQVLTQHLTPIQYIYADSLSDNSIITNRLGTYSSSHIDGIASNSIAELGDLSGNVNIDFSAHSADLDILSNIGNDTWTASGKGPISSLQAGQFGLIGQRKNNQNDSSEDASGLILGHFSGANLDTLWGHFRLTSNTDQLNGVYAFSDFNLDGYLSGLKKDDRTITGYLLEGKHLGSFSNYQIWSADNLLLGIVENSSGAQWVTNKATQQSLAVNSSTITWGSWKEGWSIFDTKELIPKQTPLHYIYADSLTDASLVTARGGLYNFNQVDGTSSDNAGTFGNVQGSLSIDFSNQQADLSLSSQMNGITWSASGKGSLNSLQSGGVALEGKRTNTAQITSTESVTGSAIGQFSGNSADSVWGRFYLSSNSDQLNGVYAFSDAKLHNYLADLSQVSDTAYGHVLDNHSSSNLSAFQRWQKDGLLLGLVNGTTQEQWIAENTTQQSISGGSALVTWGSWQQGWNRVNDQALSSQTTPIQFIYTDSLTDSSVVSNRQGIYNFRQVNGSASNKAGELGGLSGSLNIDFGNQKVGLNLSSQFSQSSWAAYGAGGINELQSGNFALSGTFSNIQKNTSETATGLALGQFSGGQADMLWGQFSLNNQSQSDKLSGLYVFSDSAVDTVITPSLKEEDFIIQLSSNGSRLLEAGSDVVTAFNYDGGLYAVSLPTAANNNSLTYKNLSPSTAQSFSYSDSYDIMRWGFWSTYSRHDGVDTDSPLFYSMIENLNTPSIDSKLLVSQRVDYTLVGGLIFSKSGGELLLDNSLTHLGLDFASGVLGMSLSMNSSDGLEQWTLGAEGNLSGLSMHEPIDINLYGTVEYSAQDIAGNDSSPMNYDIVNGTWHALWGGSSGQFFIGDISLSSEQNSKIAAEGVVAFAGDVLSYPSAKDVKGMDLVGLASVQITDGQGVSVSAHALKSGNSNNDFHLKSATDSTLMSFREDNNWITVREELATHVKNSSSYTLSTSGIAVTQSTQVAANIGDFTTDDGQNTVKSMTGNNVAEVNWGRWASSGNNSFDTNISPYNDVQALHYIYASNPTSLDTVINKVGVSNYLFAGGTAPTLLNNNGSYVGTLNKFGIEVDFSGQSLAAMLDLTLNGNTYTAIGGGGISEFLESSGIALSVEQESSVVGGGSLNGLFVGSDAEGIISQYNLYVPSGSINGAALLQQITHSLSQTSPP